MTSYHARCLCGSVQFDVELAKPEIHCCHCGLCRRWGGGPAFAAELAAPPRFADDSAVQVYRSSDWAERLFCKTCGSSLLWRSIDGHFQVVPVALLGDPPELMLSTEIFIDDKPDFYALAGERTCLTGDQVMAAFSGEADSEPAGDASRTTA